MQVRLKVQSASGHAAIVQLEHEISLLGEVLRPQIDGQAPGVKHRLSMRPAVDGDQQRMRTVAFGSIECSVERGTVCCREGAQLRCVEP